VGLGEMNYMFNGFYKNKRILVTGHTGFKGAWLTQWLLELGACVAGFSLYVPSTPSLYEVLELKNKIEKDIVGDVRDFESINNAINEFRPDIIFHLAAQPIVNTSISDPLLTFETNALGTINMLEVIRRYNSELRAILITSDKCYENVEWLFGYREIDRLGGKDPYSASKACAEVAISSYWRSFFRGTDKYVVSARAGNVIGGGDWAKDRIIPDCIKAWAEKKEVNIRNPYATRPWQHVLEPLSGYLCLGESLQRKPVIDGESFNFGPSESASYSVKELLEQIAACWGENAVWQFAEQAKKKGLECGLLKLNCDKASALLNWQSVMGFADAASFIANWYKAFYMEKNDMLDYTRRQIQEYCLLAKQKELQWAM
jgi:CDP-glucose 4,6-dehydratase